MVQGASRSDEETTNGDSFVSQDPDLSFVFLGTGTSSTVPSVACLTDPVNGCLCCRSTLSPGGERNRRRNTGGVLRITDRAGADKTVLIDCGKSFYAAAVEWFPKRGLRQLDAVLLTHPHADAMNGLDDLRAWTLGGAVQRAIHVYCNEPTFQEVKRAFPYLVMKVTLPLCIASRSLNLETRSMRLAVAICQVSTTASLGGGQGEAGTEFVWHLIDDTKPFALCGVTVTPLRVHHGRYFSKDEPYLCLGFLFNRRFAYLSDVSEIPEDVLEVLRPGSDRAAVDVLVIDVLRIAPHASHFGIGQAVSTTRLLQPRRTYWTGFAHRATHDDWVHLGSALREGRRHDPSKPARALGTLKADAFADWNKRLDQHDSDAFVRVALEEVAVYKAEGAPIWAGPAYDGLEVLMHGGSVSENSGALNE